MKIAWQYRVARLVIVVLGIVAVGYLLYWTARNVSPPPGNTLSWAGATEALLAATGAAFICLIWAFAWSVDETGAEQEAAEPTPVPPPVRHDIFCPHCRKPIAVIQAVPGASPIVVFKPEQEAKPHG